MPPFIGSPRYLERIREFPGRSSCAQVAKSSPCYLRTGTVDTMGCIRPEPAFVEIELTVHRPTASLQESEKSSPMDPGSPRAELVCSRCGAFPEVIFRRRRDCMHATGSGIACVCMCVPKVSVWYVIARCPSQENITRRERDRDGAGKQNLGGNF